MIAGRCLLHYERCRFYSSREITHKFRHNSKDPVNPMCPTNDGVEDTEHFLLLCPSFAVQRQNLLVEILPLLQPFGYANLSNEVLTQLLLHCNITIHQGNRSFRLTSFQTLLRTTQPASTPSLRHLFVLFIFCYLYLS